MNLRAFSHFTNMILYCRPGFEPEAAAELVDWSQDDSDPDEEKSLFDKIKPLQGYVLATTQSNKIPAKAINDIPYEKLVFARQMLFGLTTVYELPEKNKLDPIMAALTKVLPAGVKFSAVFVETVDVDRGDEVAKFCKTFQPHVLRAAKKLNLMSEQSTEAPRLHVFFPDYKHAHLLVSDPRNSSPWMMGIPRFRLPKDAPSRSWLKIDEAFQTLMTEHERGQLLRSGMKAVDLGAAPGGWTHYLTQKDMMVWAIDNAKLTKELLQSDNVQHIQMNAFDYKPPSHMDWLVCDMVEQPKLIVELVLKWFQEKRCKRALFNLKLPMRRRYEETNKCLFTLQQQLGKQTRRFEIRAKQLYHDRKEVSVLVLSESK